MSVLFFWPMGPLWPRKAQGPIGAPPTLRGGQFAGRKSRASRKAKKELANGLCVAQKRPF